MPHKRAKSFKPWPLYRQHAAKSASAPLLLMFESMILSTVRLVISAQARPEVIRILRVFMGHATAKTGCAAFSISQDLTDPETLTVSDRWATQEDFDEHVRSAEYRLLLAVMDLSVTPPEISFDELAHLGDLDLVQALRAPEHTIRNDDST
jgi:quinol monooxygenase YgiN